MRLKENRSWLESLHSSYVNQEDPNDILQYDELVDKISSDLVRKAAQKYFDNNNLVEVVLFPTDK